MAQSTFRLPFSSLQPHDGAIGTIEKLGRTGEAGAMMVLREVPLVDLRLGGPPAHARRERALMLKLRSTCLDFFPLAGLWLPIADPIAMRWLRRSQSAYSGEVEEIARLAGVPGVHLINTAYEWGCTAACRSTAAPWLLRTLDWPFAGMGRALSVARQAGPAGEFLNVTWPGAVGVLTAMAPGRFAATINQAPLRRRTRGEWLRWADYAVNAVRTYARIRFAPPAHVLRQAFETAPDYESAKRFLMTTPVARPVLFALAGTRAGETCLIERTETDGRLLEGPFVVANDWQQPRPGWEPRSCGGPVERDSRDRQAALAEAVGRTAEPFDWLRPPVHNWATRVAVEMCAGMGALRAIGFEPLGGHRPSTPATRMFDLARICLAA